MSETEAITELVFASQRAPAILKDTHGYEHAFIPTRDGGYTREVLTPAGSIVPKPAYINQRLGVDNVFSLVDYVNRFKTENTIIIASTRNLEVHALIDYHSGGSASAGFNQHRAILRLAYSAEWDTWKKIDGEMYGQKEFARMLDVNSDDIAKPTAAELLETVMDLEMKQTVTVQRRLQATGSSRGDGAISKNVEGTVLPPFFLLSIPVFTGQPRRDVRAMTMDHLDGNTGKLSLGLELVRTRLIVENEVASICAEIGNATGVPVFVGSVEDKRIV